MIIPLHVGTAAVLAGTVASIALAIPPASAQEASIVVQSLPRANLRVARVPIWDLNLATRVGEQSMHRRVSRAVERVCDYDPIRAYGLSEPDYNYCTTGAWQRARPQMIGAVYRARALAYGAAYYHRY